ncbi:MAG TPA: MHYT domain-containing protein [Caulobacteraceae bacterium]|nr:MHYT domain-containing protein [Caulobacteraceae bacterium]
MHAANHLVFVVLSFVVAVFGSWTALDLFRRVRTHVGRARAAWLVAAAVAMGASIWSMHFIAMLGFDPGSPVRYDPGLTFLSLALAVGATCGAFFAASGEHARPLRLVVAGAAMGAGICLMHYTGMAALRTAVSLGYDLKLVALSLVIAVVASTAALFAGRRDRSFRWRVLAAPILGGAIVGMHYTAMAALKITRTEAAAEAAAAGAPPFVLAGAVAAGSLLILFLALVASLYDQRVNVLAALEAGGVGYWELSLPDRTLQVSAKAKEVLGRRSDEPLGYAEFEAVLDDEERIRREALLARTLAEGEDHDAVYRLKGEPPRWVNIRGRVLRDPVGRPRKMIGVALDVTDRLRAFADLETSERRQRLLIDELNHRVKNTLATVQSIAAQTARRAEDVETFQRTFESRLIALSRTHDALTQGGWESASLRGLLLGELKPYSGEQANLRGPDVRLGPRQALGLGMAFHELATNAAKYGALSVPEGCVRVSWEVAEDRLVLDWTERNGPPITGAPERRGFGSRLIRATVEQELGGQAGFEYAPEGLHCRISVPLHAPGRLERAA